MKQNPTAYGELVSPVVDVRRARRATMSALVLPEIVVVCMSGLSVPGLAVVGAGGEPGFHPTRLAQACQVNF